MKIFDSIQGFRPKKNKFDLSHERKMSLSMGTLVPFMMQEIMPGDSFRVHTEMLLRLQPLLAPVFHRMKCKTDYFFVPNRLVWDNWTKFITGGDKGTDAPVHPYITMNQQLIDFGYLGKKTLADYLGIPAIEDGTPFTGSVKISSLPFRAYQLIYNEFYRDQNLIDPIPFGKGDGAEVNIETVQLRTRAWEKDYFTSALPWAQKGGAVALPTDINYKPQSTVHEFDGTLAEAGADLVINAAEAGGLQAKGVAEKNVRIENIDGFSTTINDLRVSVRLQEWLERQARAGSRYIETILSNFGILSSDARLQRPEWLGGGMNPIVISEVLSTYQNADDTGYPQGTMKGHGIATGYNGGFKRTFEEHGYIFGIMTVLPTTAYQQGIPKTFLRTDKLEYPWPSFAQLGEQAIENQELYLDPANEAGRTQPFGYQSRYAEYKYNPSTVHGDFKDNLSYWHMGRIFSAPPVLNGNFVTADPTKRIFAVEDQTENEILCQVYNRIDAIRPLPYFNTPSL